MIKVNYLDKINVWILKISEHELNQYIIDLVLILYKKQMILSLKISIFLYNNNQYLSTKVMFFMISLF